MNENKEHIAAYLRAIWTPGEVREIRAEDRHKSIYYAYFDNPDDAASAIMARASGLRTIWVTLNPCLGACMARHRGPSFQRPGKREPTTSDSDIKEIQYVLIDVDPNRPAGTPSSAEELESARKTADKIMEQLGKPRIFGMSGNGYHLIYRTNATDPAQTAGIIRDLHEQYGQNGIGIDRKVCNKSRITKVMGTRSVKGNPYKDRIHRISELIEANQDDTILDLSKYKAQAEPSRHAQGGQGSSAVGPGAREYLQRVLALNGLEVIKEKDHNGNHHFCLQECIFDRSHKDNESSFFISASGAICYQCFHDSCTGKKWSDARELLKLPAPQTAKKRTRACNKCGRDIFFLLNNIDGTWNVMDAEKGAPHKCPKPKKTKKRNAVTVSRAIAPTAGENSKSIDSPRIDPSQTNKEQPSETKQETARKTPGRPAKGKGASLTPTTSPATPATPESQKKGNASPAKKLTITQADAVRFRIQEADRATFAVYTDQKTDTWELLANFTARIISEIYNDDESVSYEVELRSRRQTRRICCNGQELNLLQKFSERIALAGAYLVYSTSKIAHNEFVNHVLRQSAAGMKHKKQTKFLGRVPSAHGTKSDSGRQAPSYFFANGQLTADGIEPLKNIIVNRSSYLRVDLPGNSGCLQFWRTTVKLLSECYRDELFKFIGFLVGTVFADEIVSEFGFFPLLFLNGPKGCGKSTAAYIALAMFGAHREIKPLNFNSTAKAWYRQAAKYRGIPLFLNEFQPGRKTNATLQAVYDREGYQRARTSNDLETYSTEVNATFLLASTRKVSGYESQAVISRLVTMDFNGLPRNVDSKDKILAVKAHKQVLSSFVQVCLRIDPAALLRDIKDFARQTERSHDAESRIVENHTIIRCCANAFYRALCVEGTYGVGKIDGILGAAKKETESASAACRFIEVVWAIVADANISTAIAHLNDDGDLIFHLSTAYDHVRRFMSSYDRDTIPDKETLRKLLKAGAAGQYSIRSVRKANMGGHKRSWAWEVKTID